MRKLAVLMVLGVLVAGTREAAAQGEPADRVYLNIGFGVESGSTDSNDTKQYTLYDETATTNTSATWTSGSFFGGGVDFRVFKNLTVGLAYHQETNTSDTAVTGDVPHPIFFNRPRTFSADAGGMYRRENATHLSFGWIVPITPKLDVLVSAGPSFFRLQQDVVSDVTIAERGGDFTEVVVAPTVVTQKRSATGYNVAADVTYMLWQNDSMRIGAGGFFRYTEAKTDVRLLVSDFDTTIGGLQFGFGARIRF
ncbi:MAG: hypothetical protein AB7P34_14355 [Vicinamibacterales bacterium]